MKKILVFTDFSKCAHLASSVSIEIASKFGCEILFVHYMNNVPDGWEIGSLAFRKGYANTYSDYLKNSCQLAELERSASDEKVIAKSKLIYNFSASKLSPFIEENKIDYVIMGSHGRSSFEEFMMGSNAQEMVRHSPVPIMVIKREFSISKAHLIFISDFSAEADGAFNKLVDFSNLIEAPISLLYVNSTKKNAARKKEDRERAEMRMSAFKSRGGTSIQEAEIVDEKSLEAGIEKYCSSKTNPVISMGTHGRQGVERLFLGSQTEKVVNRLVHPVIGLPI
ncbi:MAG: universal stress protein [Reichenbachiella sp.]|uniref:universal stress protein n=1 Tax=Reichenbachiella sp. TaxID=2184521 RepID=UPI0032675049